MNRFFLLLWTLSISLYCFSQARPAGESDQSVSQLFSQFDRLYGRDYNLVNGFPFDQHNANYHSGHPFFGEDRFYKGSIVIRGVPYAPVDLKYNVHEQEIILFWKKDILENRDDLRSQVEQLLEKEVILPEDLKAILEKRPLEDADEGGTYVKLHTDFVQEFRLEDRTFRKMAMDNMDPLYYQVIESGSLCCLIHHSKVKREELRTYAILTSFSNPRRKFYLLSEGKLHPFRNGRSFARLFSKEDRKTIRKEIRTSEILFNTVTDMEIKGLLAFCSGLINGEGMP